MRYALILFALTALVIASCAQEPGTLQSVSLEEPVVNTPQPPKNTTTAPVLVVGGPTCGDQTCAKDQLCVKGKCQCLEGFKSCGGACIAKAACCSDKDCQGTETCVNNQCEFSCSRVICPTNQVCSQDEKRCTCPKDYRFCQVQNKCIPTGFCCDKFDCGRGEGCTQTLYSAHVCLLSNQPFCKYVGEKASKVIAINNKTFDVTAAEFFYGHKVKMIVDGKSFVMEDGAQEKLENGVTLKVDEVRELGGKCRPIEDL